MLDDHYTTETSIWIVMIPMLVSVYIASLLIVAVFVNVIDDIGFVHISSFSREIYINCSIFIAFMFSSFCISISTYIAIPAYKKLFMVIVFFIPIIWPNLISLFLFGIENRDYENVGISSELILFISGSIFGGYIAYYFAAKFDTRFSSND